MWTTDIYCFWNHWVDESNSWGPNSPGRHEVPSAYLLWIPPAPMASRYTNRFKWAVTSKPQDVRGGNGYRDHWLWHTHSGDEDVEPRRPGVRQPRPLEALAYTPPDTAAPHVGWRLCPRQRGHSAWNTWADSPGPRGTTGAQNPQPPVPVLEAHGAPLTSPWIPARLAVLWDPNTLQAVRSKMLN